MELKQRKRIKSRLPKFYPGVDAGNESQSFINPNYNYFSTIPNTNPGYTSSLSSIGTINTRIKDPGAIPSAGETPLPKQQGAGVDWGGVGNGVAQSVQASIAFGGAVNDSFSNVAGTDELVGGAGRRNGNIMGIGYDKIDYIDRNARMNELRAENHQNNLKAAGAGAGAGAAIGGTVGTAITPGAGTAIGAGIGAIVGGIGGLVTGLAGSRRRKQKLRKRIAEAQRRITAYNDFSRQSAMTQGLEQNYYLNNGDTSDDLLYANRGKDLKQPKRK